MGLKEKQSQFFQSLGVNHHPVLFLCIIYYYLPLLYYFMFKHSMAIMNDPFTLKQEHEHSFQHQSFLR